MDNQEPTEQAPVTGASNLPPGLAPQTDIPRSRQADIQSDVARILQDVKLPERRGTPPVARIPETPLPPADEPKIISETEVPSPGATDETPATTDSESQSRIRSHRTFREDVLGLMRSRSVSVANEVVMQQEKSRTAALAQEDEEVVQVKRTVHRTKVGIIVTTLTLTLMGIAAIGAVIYIAAQQTPQTNVTSNSLLFAEQTHSLPIDTSNPLAFANSLGLARSQSTLTLGAIMHLIPTLPTTNDTTNTTPGIRVATINEFLTALGARPPDVLTRTFTGDFFLGIHTLDQNVPILVIPITSYERAQEGMLEWEKTINPELSPLYTRVPANLPGDDGVLHANDFQDVIINNFDTRVLHDSAGDVRMLYAFPSKSLLVIVESSASFTEVLSRLRAGRQL